MQNMEQLALSLRLGIISATVLRMGLKTPIPTPEQRWVSTKMVKRTGFEPVTPTLSR